MGKRNGKDKSVKLEVTHFFDPETYVSVARRIVAIVGRQFYGSNRTLHFEFRNEKQRTEAIEKLTELEDVRGYEIRAERVGDNCVVMHPRDTQVWACRCGYQSFMIRGDGAIVCWTCNTVQKRIRVPEE